MDIEIRALATGADEDSYWVTLGFESGPAPSDALHIACGRQEGRTPECQGLYFERTDQGMSDYNLAHSIVVTPDTLTIRFTEAGEAIVQLTRVTRFLLPSALEGRKDAIECFQLMAQTANGGVLDLQL
jgi:hypothetical protein